MGAPTSITVSVDATEYSRYELAHDTITVTVSINGGAPYTDEPVLVELIKARRSRDAVVASVELEFSGATDPVSQTTTFYLPDVVDQDLINLVHRGRYFVKASHVATSLESVTDDFDIRIITVDSFKKDYLFGIPLSATQVRMPKFQPVAITGVEILEVSPNHPLGLGTLSFHRHVDGTTVIRTLSWKGGPVSSINAVGTYILQSGSSSPIVKLGLITNSEDYIIVRISDLSLLPSVDTTESILIQQQEMDDSVIGHYLDKAVSWIEKDFLAGVYLEPTNLVTDRDPTTIQFAAGISAPTPIFTDTDFDELVSPLTYFIPKHHTSWVEVWTPYKQLLRVDSLFGSIANTRVIDIDLDWIELSQQGGLIQLVPFNQEVAFNFIGLLWVNAIRGAVELPNFWHFNLIAGLRDCTPDLQELIAKKAAVEILTTLAAAFRPGLGSQSLSRDGVSQSLSFLNQLQYGIYNAKITSYKEWMEENEYKYRARYQGIVWGVL